MRQRQAVSALCCRSAGRRTLVHLPNAWTVVAAMVLLAGCTPASNAPEAPVDGETDDVEAVPSRTGPWQREEMQAPGSIAFDEILYHPASDDDLEWIELHNPMALDMD